MKTNFGHAQSASGALGLMKAVLALQHGIVPQNLHFTRLPDGIAAHRDESLCAAGEHASGRPMVDHPRRAAVSSYGVSGTNVHADPGAGTRSAEGHRDGADTPDAAPLMFALSSSSAEELRRTAGRLADWVQAHDDVACRISATPWHAGARTARYAPPSSPTTGPATEALREVADGDTPYQRRGRQRRPRPGMGVLRTGFAVGGDGCRAADHRAGVRRDRRASWSR